MIVVRVELWPKGWEGKPPHELMHMHITNDGTASDGTGDSKRGNYSFELLRKGSKEVLRTGRVEDFPRRSYHVGRLLYRALASVYPEER